MSTAREAISQYLPWCLSAMSVLMAIVNGNLWRHTWLFGLAIQCFWLVWIAASKNYGFLPLCLFLFGVYIRNHLKWSKR